MQSFDYHTHTVMSDGKNTAEEMVKAAIKLGLSEYGISDHSYNTEEGDCCLAEGFEDEYKKCISELREKYKDKIKILSGIEQDYYSETVPEGYDYVIGSVHHLKIRGEDVPVDYSADILKDAANKYFSGDFAPLYEEYYKRVADVVRKTGATIIGHFDLITKFNEKEKLFDETDERYRRAWRAAVDALIPCGIPFEINTGAISRGHRTTPYPSAEIRDYIREKGGRLILSSDSHSEKNIAFEFEKYNDLL